MIIIAWIAIGLCMYVALMVSVIFITGCNAYDRRINELEAWQKRAEKGLDKLMENK